MLLLRLDPKNKAPLFKQVFYQLKALIDSNSLKPGDKLPSTRSLALKLGLNRTTVFKAYEELWARGYTESSSGSYTTVRKRAEIATHKRIEENEIIEWDNISSPNSRILTDSIEVHKPRKAGKDQIDFVSLSPDPGLMPVEDFRHCLNHVIKTKSGDLLTYGDPRGYKPLREYLADHMHRHSISVAADEILITNGTQNAIELILKLLVKQGTKIISEAPTYSLAIPLFNYYKTEIIEIPMTETGMDLDALENTIRKERSALIYTMPNFHNPTGITTNQAHREKLLALCEEYRIPLMEDGFVEEMKYFGKAVLPIKSMDRYGIVFYLGTFSKILFPGLRLGWIAAHETCIRRLSSITHALHISGNSLSQAALHRFCESGAYDLHLKRAHRIYRKRMQTALKSLKDYLPQKFVSYTKPAGGYTIWVRIENKNLGGDELVNHIDSYGVAVSPGTIFFPGKPDIPCFRISIAHQDENQIEEGIKRIGRALNDLL
ncbi:MAG: PLP-dependent aminotransferase family protein [Spirochaetales bacterium]|nr:PLP-dependent aminotransferase family protein [Spirochaetales bacterium]